MALLPVSGIVGGFWHGAGHQAPRNSHRGGTPVGIVQAARISRRAVAAATKARSPTWVTVRGPRLGGPARPRSHRPGWTGRGQVFLV